MNEFKVGEYFSKEYIQRGLIEPNIYKETFNDFNRIVIEKDGRKFEFRYSHIAKPFMLYRLVRITEPNGRYKQWVDPFFADDDGFDPTVNDLPDWINT